MYIGRVTNLSSSGPQRLSAEIERERRPVWSAFLELIPIGWEPLEGEDFERLARGLAASPYSLRELRRIFWDEVFPTRARDWPTGFTSWSELHPLCRAEAEKGWPRRWIERGLRLSLASALVVIPLLAISPLALLSALLLWRSWEIARDAERLIGATARLRGQPG